MQRGKPIHLPQRMNDTPYSIIVQYQAEYRGIVQYYRPAYNLHQLAKLKHVMEESLVKTLAKKLKMSRAAIFKRFKTDYTNEYGTYKVLEVRVERGPDKRPLVARFGGIPLQWSKWGTMSDTIEPIWSQRSEVVQRLLAEKCELCGATTRLEAHHIRKLADLTQKGRGEKPKWMQKMVARHRKSLMVCQRCHNDIHAGRYDGPSFSKHSHWRATCATNSKDWRPKKAKSVVQHLLLAFFTGIYDISKKAKFVRECAQKHRLSESPDTVSLLYAPFVHEVGRTQLREREGAG
jgi:AI2M/AI1M-like HNH endonuclease/type II intron maturase